MDSNASVRGKGKHRSEVKVKTETIFEMPSKLPELSLPDINECPVYLAAVKKFSRGVHLKDLVTLLQELEYIHLCMQRRHEQVKTEISCFENPAAKKSKRSRSSDSAAKKTGKKSKKYKGSGSKISSANRSKNKFIQPPPRSYECGVTDAQVETPKVQKNDGPSRFWSFIDPYCADIVDDDIKTIEDWIRIHNEDAEYLKVPRLGTHFAEQWPKEDMEEEAREGAKSVENQKGSIESDKILSDKERILKLGEIECKKAESKSYGQQRSSLAERLVADLVQENVMTPLDVNWTESFIDESVKPKASSSKPKASSSKSKPSSSKSTPSETESLEGKLMRSFKEIGLDGSDEPREFKCRDEVLPELVRLQSALLPVCERNLARKKALLSAAKQEMRKQDLKKKLKEVDAKVMECYRIIHAAKCENRQPPKKIISQIEKIIDERKKVIEQLDSM